MTDWQLLQYRMPLLVSVFHWKPVDPVGNPLDPLVSHVVQYMVATPPLGMMNDNE